MPVIQLFLLLPPHARDSAFSATSSAKISDAPLSASSGVFTPCVSETYFAASSSRETDTGFFTFSDLINSASGSKPFSLAIVARVRRFCL